MQVLPRVSIKAGRVVLPDSEGYKDTDLDPVPVIQKAAEECGTVIVEDLNAVFGDMPHLDLLRKVEKLDVWVDGGIRSAENVMDVLVAGGAKAVISTRTLQSLDELEKAVKFTDNIVFQIDYCQRIQGRVASHLLSAPKAVERAKVAGVGTVIFMDSCSPSPLEEAERLFTEEMREDLYVGLLSKRQTEEAQDRDVKGVVVEALDLIGEMLSDE
jgi:phosphoribosylformimino-5-aminoimidazole carboxamide ribonucleotide (ProFAR) isomerase